MTEFKLPLSDRPDLATYRNGEMLLSRKAMALLVGITEAEAQSEWERQGRPEIFAMPKEWIRRGKALAARYGHDGMASALLRLDAEASRPAPNGDAA